MKVLEAHRSAVRARLMQSGHVRGGPESVSWKINREMAAVAGWGRAVLLQLAHPSVAAGVHDHSSFRAGPVAKMRRLRSTVGAMLAISFGDTGQLIEAAARINTIHDRINGRVFPASDETYSAHDPELLRWVHATLLDSILLTYERLIGPLTIEERDQYCLEASIMEPLLGMPDGWLPRDAAQLEAYMCERLAPGRAVAVTDRSRAIARAVLHPPLWRLAWPVFRSMQLLTIGTLPQSIRQSYGFEWRARDERSLARVTAVLRTALRMLPRLAREWPMARKHQRVDSELKTCRKVAFRPGS